MTVAVFSVNHVFFKYKFKSLFSTWGSFVLGLPLNPLALTGVKYNSMALYAGILLRIYDQTISS